MAIRKQTNHQEGRVKKKTRQGCGTHSKGMKKLRGQGGPARDASFPKNDNNNFNINGSGHTLMLRHVKQLP